MPRKIHSARLSGDPMRRFLSACFLFAACATACAQIAATSPITPPAPARLPPIDGYIHNAWDTLSRSMSECRSLVDPKVTTEPILYLPAGMATPPAVDAMHSQCK